MKLVALKVNSNWSGAFNDKVFYTLGTAEIVKRNINFLYSNTGLSKPIIEVAEFEEIN